MLSTAWTTAIIAHREWSLTEIQLVFIICLHRSYMSRIDSLLLPPHPFLSFSCFPFFYFVQQKNNNTRNVNLKIRGLIKMLEITSASSDNYGILWMLVFSFFLFVVRYLYLCVCVCVCILYFVFFFIGTHHVLFVPFLTFGIVSISVCYFLSCIFTVFSFCLSCFPRIRSFLVLDMLKNTLPFLLSISIYVYHVIKYCLLCFSGHMVGHWCDAMRCIFLL